MDLDPPLIDLDEIEENIRHLLGEEIKIERDQIKVLGIFLRKDNGPVLPPEKLEKMKILVNGAISLQNVSVGYQLIEKCGVFPRANYFLRCCPSTEIADFISAADVISSQALEELFAISLSPVEHLQAQLKKSKGGLGLRLPSNHAECARIGSTILSRPLVRAILRISPASPGPESSLSAAVARFNLLVDEPNRLGDLSSADPAVFTQKALSQRVNAKIYSSIRTHFAGDLPNLARLTAVCAPRAGDFLSPFLNSGPQMSNLQFTTASLHHLGHDLNCGAAWCPKTHSVAKALDPLSSHQLVCKPDGDPIARHDEVKHYVTELAREARLPFKVEPLGLLPNAGSGNLKPADLLLLRPNGRNRAIDFTIANSVQHQTLQRAAVEKGVVATLREQAKIAKYRQHCSNHGLDFTPFAIETYGALGPSAMSLMHDLATVLSRHLDLDLGPLKKRLFIELSTVLKRSLANSILSRRPTSSSRFGSLPGPH